MKKIKDAYYYLFYRFYLFSETPPSDGNGNWKAAGFISILEIFVFFSGGFYYKTYFDRSYDMPITLYAAAMATVMIVNYLAFLRNDIWMDYYEKFENWPFEKNKKGGIIVLSIIITILICFAVSIYLFNKIIGFKK